MRVGLRDVTRGMAMDGFVLNLSKPHLILDEFMDSSNTICVIDTEKGACELALGRLVIARFNSTVYSVVRELKGGVLLAGRAQIGSFAQAIIEKKSSGLELRLVDDQGNIRRSFAVQRFRIGSDETLDVA